LETCHSALVRVVFIMAYLAPAASSSRPVEGQPLLQHAHCHHFHSVMLAFQQLPYI